MKTWKRITAFAVSMAMAAGLLAGCGGEKAAAKEEPKNIITVSIDSDPEHLDESVSLSTTAWWASCPVNDYLLVFDDQMNLVNELAEEYSMKDELSFYFKLRKGVKFHNGREVQAKDVAYSLERHLDPALGSALADSLACIESIELLDDYSGIVHLSEPYAPFLSKLPKVAIVPEECADTLKTAPVGCGPFKFVSWEHDQKVTYEKFADYWQAGLPKADGIVFKVLPEYNSQHSALLTGETDILLWADNSDVSELEKDENVYIHEQPVLDAYYLAANCTAAPFDNVLVRQAISLAVDRDACIKAALDGKAAPIYAPVPNSSYYYDESLKSEKNIEEAKKLLAEAGYADGFTVSLVAPATAVEGQLCDLIQAQLKEIGITAESEKQDVATFLDNVFSKKEFELAICGDSGDADPETLAFNYLYTDAGANICSYSNAEFDKLMNEGRTTYDKELRKKAYTDAFMIAKEDAPMTWIAGGYLYSAVRKDVEGLVGYPTQKFSFTNVTRK